MKPLLIYTMDVTSLTYHDQELSYKFSDDLLTVKYEGGAEYTHRVWDYNLDHVVVNYGFCTYYSSIAVRKIDATRKVVLITPVRKIWNPLARYYYPSNLKFLTTTIGDFNILKTYDKVNSTIKINLSKKDNPDVSASIPLDIFTILKGKYIHDPKCTVSVFERTLKMLIDDPKNKIVAREALLAFDFMVENAESTAVIQDFTHSYDNEDYNYESISKTVFPTIKIYGRIVMTPILDEAKVPCFSYDTDQVIISERLLRIQNNKMTVSAQMVTYMTEFCCLLFPERHILHPFEEHEVDAAQSKPSQRSSFERAQSTLNSKLQSPQSFTKKEAYSKFQPARNITNVSHNHRIRYSRYTLPLAQYIKENCTWYAFGMKPSEIATRIHELASVSDKILPTDFSKFDGTHSYTLHLLECMVLNYGFSREQYNEISTIMKAEIKQTVKTSYELEYNSGFSRLSGSPGTSLFNTINNCFIAYVAYRIIGHSPERVYHDMLGIYGGDDGLSPDCTAAEFARSCELIGCIPKAHIQSANDPLVFLGRIYTAPSVHNGSMIDIRRCLGKLHLSTRPMSDSAEQIIADKAMSIVVTDPDTPILGQWAEAVMHLSGGYIKKTKLTMSEHYWAYMCERTGDVFPKAPRSEMYEIASEELKVTMDDLENFERLILENMKAKDVTKLFLGCYIEPELQVDIEAAFRGEVLQPREKKEIVVTSPPYTKVMGEIPIGDLKTQVHNTGSPHKVEKFAHEPKNQHKTTSFPRTSSANRGSDRSRKYFDTHPGRKPNAFKANKGPRGNRTPQNPKEN